MEFGNILLIIGRKNQVDRYYDMLLDIYQDIADNPELGKNYEGIKSELFGLKANRHVIFYRKLTLKNLITLINVNMSIKC